MPSARDLLDQVDALMRRNRSRDRDKRNGPATLTDALGARRDSVLAPTVILPDAERSHATPIGPEVLADADPISLETLADVPVLTDVVDVWPGSDARATSGEAIANAEPGQQEEATPVRAAALHDAPAASVTSAPEVEEEFILEIPPAPAPASEPKPALEEHAVIEWPPHEVPEPAATTPDAVA